MTERYQGATSGLIQQTAILRDVDLPEVHLAEGGEAQVAVAHYSWLVVLTQECDLQFDRLARAGKSLVEGGPAVKKDKVLRSILLCPAFPQEHVLAGVYVTGATQWKGTQKDILLQNRHERYHILAAEAPLVTEPLVLDFKLIVAAHPEYLERWVRDHPHSLTAVIRPPYRDRLVQRFVNYFGRIAEPEGD